MRWPWLIDPKDVEVWAAERIEDFLLSFRPAAFVAPIIISIGHPFRHRRLFEEVSDPAAAFWIPPILVYCQISITVTVPSLIEACFVGHSQPFDQRHLNLNLLQASSGRDLIFFALHQSVVSCLCFSRRFGYSN
jgi:hypothetical protein